MRKVVIRQRDSQEVDERLISLLATSLERLLANRRQGLVGVDLCPDESVTTTCADQPGVEEPEA